jgi:hypothetical protein
MEPLGDPVVFRNPPQANLSTVFNYAKDHLGLIAINPARDIEPPKVRITANHLRG